MAMSFSFAQAIHFANTPLSHHTNPLRTLILSVPFSYSSSSSSALSSSKKWRQPVVSVLELGGVKIANDGSVEMRWIDTYFPFTNPSFELEIFFQEKWLEVLGCGVKEQEILKRSDKTNNIAWAFWACI